MTRMKRCLLLLLAITICVSIGLAQKPAPRASSVSSSKPDPKSWVEFSSPEGRFSILFPGTPIRNHDPIDTRAGSVPVHTYTVPSDAAVYVVCYSDMPGGIASPDLTTRMLDGGRDR